MFKHAYNFSTLLFYSSHFNEPSCIYNFKNNDMENLICCKSLVFVFHEISDFPELPFYHMYSKIHKYSYNFVCMQVSDNNIM